MQLGYSRPEAAQSLEKAKQEAGDEPEPRVETLVRLGLKHLFRG
jgi:Holliday junction resolvasome RuvABC DNA-binding subunit